MRLLDTGIEYGQVVPIREIAARFFEVINPKDKRGNFEPSKSVIGRIEKQLNDNNGTLREFYLWIIDAKNNYTFLKRLITAPANELEDSVKTEIDEFLSSRGIQLNETSRKEIIDTLGYSYIRQNYTQWIIDCLGIKACPYCGMQYILGISSPNEKKVLCEIDHFFPKSLYPYLCISFYNLIPCCSFCNRLKSASGTSLKTHPHPYHDNLDRMFKFSTDPEEVIGMICKGKPIVRIVQRSENSDRQRIENHFSRFRMDALYAHHTDIVQELFWKRYIYPESRKNELERLFKEELGLTTYEVERFIVGNYVEDEDMLKRPLAKLMRDIAREVRLIDLR